MNTRRSQKPAVGPKGASKPKAEEIEILAIDDDLGIGSILTAALQESETRYRLLADNVTDVIWAGDLNLRHIYVSPSITGLTGYSVEEFMGKQMEEILTLASFEMAKMALAEELVIQNTARNDPPKSQTLELEMNRKDGSTVWTEAKMTFLVDSNDHLIGVVGVIWDITERRRMEEELRESEAKLHTIFESIRDGIIVVDLEGHIVEVNEATLHMTGYDKQELIGRSAFEVVAPDDRVRAMEAMRQALEKGATQETMAYTVSAADGREFDAEFSGALMRDPHGNPTGFIGVMRDITERKRTEELMNLLSTAVKTSVDAISVASHIDGRLVFCNEAFLKRWKLDGEYNDMHYSDCFDLDPQSDVVREVAKATLAGGWSGELVARAVDGQTFPVLVTSCPVVDKEGRILGLLGIFRDISERKRAEEEKQQISAQLLQAQKMEAIGTLAGGIAHDFNNIITAIMGYVDVAVAEVDEPASLYTYLTEINAACSNAARLTSQLLLFGRKNPLQVVPLNINEVVRNVQQMLKRLLREDIAVEAYLEPDIFTIQADRGNIEQVIMNLAVNARDAMPEGGKLTLMSENVILSKKHCQPIPGARPGSYVCLSVADTGTGIDKEIIPYIFEPFFTTKEPGGGTGLGLSVVYGIVKQHGGWISVYSEPGQGSTFQLYLPGVPGSPEGKDDETMSPEQIRANGERILLVEDDRGVREFLAEALSENGYVVFEAASARDALEVFDSLKGSFLIVFIDVVLPDMSGLELVDQIHSRSPELPVLLGSGYLHDKLEWLLVRERRFPVLHKPYNLGEVLRAIRAIIGTAQG